MLSDRIEKIMLQRIQSLYLFLVSGISGSAGLLLPYGYRQGNALYSYDHVGILTGICACVALALVAIFLFKNRKLQFVLGRINIILNFILLGVFVYWSLMVSGGAVVPEKGIGMFIPIISIVLLVLANKAIKKDEDLVKSVDRLR